MHRDFRQCCDVRVQLKHHVPLDYFSIHQGSYSRAIGSTQEHYSLEKNRL